MRIVMAFVFFVMSTFLVSTFVMSAEAALAVCEPADLVRQRDLQDQYETVVKDLNRANVRLQGQRRRQEGLPSHLASRMGQPPEPPAATAEGFDADGTIGLNCEEPQTVGPSLSAAEQGLQALEAAVTAYAAAVDAREDQLIALEDAAAGEEGSTAQAAPDEGSGKSSVEMEPVPDGHASEGGGAAPQGEGEGEGEGEARQSDDRQTPLLVEGNDLVYQRVLTLPEARFHDEPGDAKGEADEVPPFSVLYVFDRREVAGSGWVLAGPKFAGEPAGWLPDEKTLAWDSALVMQFASVGQRERVLFFNESRDLIDIVVSPFFAEDAKEIYQKLKAGELEDDRFVAAEPATAVDYANEPYLLPIIAHVQQQFDNGTPTTLFKVASASVKTSRLERRDEDSLKSRSTDGNLQDFRIGVVFVMDTTVSMQPYIERTRETVKAFYDAFAGAEQDVKASFGLIAYRDNLDHDARIEYVTRVYQPLDPEARSRSVIANIGSVEAAKAASVDWREDAYAAIAEAIEDFDWEPFDAKVIFLVTDAGARDGNDPLAARPEVDTRFLVEAARQKKIAIIPIHLITPEAERANKVSPARAQYSALGGETGDANSMKYLPVDAVSDKVFAREIAIAANQIVDAVRKAAANQRVDASEDAGSRSPAVNDGYITSDGGSGDGASGDGRLARLVANEILRAQLEFLGEQDDIAAPSFISGWASDRDLTDPDRMALEVSVFLTRNQLSALAESVSLMTDAFKSAGTSPGAFFDQLQLVAAKTARDPERVRHDETAAIREILPSFLQGLPYRSDVLRLNRQYWDSISTSDRQAFVENLESKLKVYRALYAQTDNWVDFGAGDPALEAYPLRLKQLP